jgi:CDP-glycerol glycerophosphotransferase (TagB/SpsB family)
LLLDYLEANLINEIEAFLGDKARVVRVNAFDRKLKKAIVYGTSYLRLLFDKRLVNIYQSYSPKLMNKRFVKRKITNVFLYHGWGTKKSPGNFEVRTEKGLKYWRDLRKNTDYIICHSDFDATYCTRHELLDYLPLPAFLPLGHPRNDFLVRNANNKDFISQQKKSLGIPEKNIVVLFAPTHRESVLLNNDYDEKLLKSFMLELGELDQYLYERGITFLFRPHYYFAGMSSSSKSFKSVRIFDFSKIRDPRILMLVSDVLITDYSSIYVDYLLLQKPIIFYTPDLDYYQQVRGLVIDPENPTHMPGPKINRLKDILDITERDLSVYDLKTSRAFFHKYWDDQSTARLAKFLLGLCGKDE